MLGEERVLVCLLRVLCHVSNTIQYIINTITSQIHIYIKIEIKNQ